MSSYQHWKVNTDEDGICWLHLDKAESSTNVLSADVFTELETELERLNTNPPRGVVFLSDKKNGFIAGADINEFTSFDNEHEALTAIQRGQAIMNSIESLPCTTIALINGFCFGGGLELALACTYRVAENDIKTKLGLPEVKLGIHPGFGGSVRCIELIGPMDAFGLILTGRNISARAAKKIGLINFAVPRRHLLTAAKNIIINPSNLRNIQKKIVWWKKLLNHKLVRPWFAKVLSKKVAKKANRSHYPAPYTMIEIWERFADDRQRMFNEEAASVARLMLTKTSQNLIRVFGLQETMKTFGRIENYNPQRIHVIGGGVMGGDIAAWCALQGFRVTIQDQKHETIARVMNRAYKLYKRKLKDKLLITTTMDRLIPDINGNGISQADIVIEAIFEDAEVKRSLYKEVEPKMKDGAILATNTSSIPLEELTAALKHPQRLVGLHFFNPVAMMPLVEIVKGKKTDDDSMQKAAAITKRISRLPLPVTSSPGFLVNRILMPYLMEAVVLADEGVPLTVIDKAATEFGMPMGPIELADTVGLDICLKVAENLSQGMDINVPERLRKMVTNNTLGKKTGSGFYNFKKGKAIKPAKPKDYTQPTDLTDRLITRMLNEAVACLRDHVVENKDLLDAGVIFGTGFAPFRGGPMCYSEDRGIEQIQKLLENLTNIYGTRFTPDAGWKTLE